MSRLLNGIAAGGGITIAPVYVMGASSLSAAEQVANDENHEAQRLHDSFSLTKNDLQTIHQQVTAEFGHPVVTVQTMLAVVDDPGVRRLAQHLLTTNHWTAEWTVDQLVARLQRLSTVAASSAFWTSVVHDFGQRLLSHLMHQPIPDVANLDHRAVVVAQTISPTQLLRFDRQLVAAIVTDTGGATSHFSLLTEELAIPGVVGTKEATKVAREGMVAIVDGIHGEVIFQPSPQEIDHYQKLAAEYAREHDSLGRLKYQPTRSADGRQIKVAANLALPDELDAVNHSGAEGIGLFRTEFMVMGAGQVLGEEQQFQVYKKLVTSMPERQVVVRTFDVGADKAMVGVGDAQANPALGIRGIRVGLRYPDLLRPQIRALLRASVYGKLALMFPMVTTLAEFQQARQVVDTEIAQLRQAGVDVADHFEVGMMVETPAAVMMADQLAQYADFFSIGSNDLGQYLFAADRSDSEVNSLLQPLHPAMLRATLHVIRAAHTEGKWVSLCGEMAANYLAEPLLLAMGLDEFSVPSETVLPLRHLISGLSTRQLQPLLHQALNLTDATAVERLIKKSLPNLYQKQD